MKLVTIIALLAVLTLQVSLTGQQNESQGQCGPQRGGHECHCPRMVAAHQQAHEETCLKEYKDCMAKMPESCDILEHPKYVEGPKDDEGNATFGKEPDSCFKYCRLDLCFCNDMRCGPHGEAVAPKKKGRRK